MPDTRLDVDNDGMVEIDQVVGSVGEEGMALERAGPLRGGIRLRDELRPVPPSVFGTAD
jgi:hypothetical protein